MQDEAVAMQCSGEGGGWRGLMTNGLVDSQVQGQARAKLHQAAPLAAAASHPPLSTGDRLQTLAPSPATDISSWLGLGLGSRSAPSVWSPMVDILSLVTTDNIK